MMTSILSGNLLSSRYRWLILIILTILLTWSFTAEYAAAQNPGPGWSAPELVYSAPSDMETNELWLLRDQADILYMWWPLFPADDMQLADGDSQTTVFHTQWIDGVWKEPIDILVWPDAGRLTAVVTDPSGLLHAFSTTNCLSYVYARQTEAMNAKAWGGQQCIDNTGNTNVAVAKGPDDTLYIVYAVPGTQSLHLAQSHDDGVTWYLGEVATVQRKEDGFFSDPALAVDGQGKLHLVWSPASPPIGYPLRGVLYSRSDDSGRTWTDPVQIAREHEGQAAIAAYGDEVHVLWNGDAGKRGRYYRYSADAGQSWGPIEVLGAGGGLQRPPALIVDNIGHVHALLHEQEYLYYISKDENGWTAKEPLYTPQSLNAEEVFTVRLAITGGNQLHALYTLSEEPDSHKSIYYQHRTIDAQPAALTPWPTPTSLPQVTPEPTATLTPVLPETEYLNTGSVEQTLSSGQLLPLAVSTLAVLILMGVLLLWRAALHRKG